MHNKVSAQENLKREEERRSERFAATESDRTSDRVGRGVRRVFLREVEQVSFLQIHRCERVKRWKIRDETERKRFGNDGIHSISIGREVRRDAKRTRGHVEDIMEELF